MKIRTQFERIIKLRRSLKTSPSHPNRIHLNITDRCDCRCWHCELAEQSSSRELSLAAVEEIFRLARGWHAPVLLSGGEPMLHTQIWAILELAGQLSIDVCLMTNGHRLANLHDSERRLVLNSVGELLVSLDSGHARLHDAMRGRPASHACVMACLDSLAKDIPTWLVASARPDFANIPTLIELAEQRGIGLIVQPYIYVSNFPGLTQLSDKPHRQVEMSRLADQIMRRVDVCSRKARRLGVPSNLALLPLYIREYYSCAGSGELFTDQVLRKFYCTVPWQQLTVAVDGSIQPCVFLPGSDNISEGNVERSWKRQADRYWGIPLAAHARPECKSCSCHFMHNMRDSLLMAPWLNRVNLLPYIAYQMRRKLTESKTFIFRG